MIYDQQSFEHTSTNYWLILSVLCKCLVNARSVRALRARDLTRFIPVQVKPQRYTFFAIHSRSDYVVISLVYGQRNTNRTVIL